MNKITIMTDSTCDLSEELIKEKGIAIVPLYVTFGDEVYKDKVEITSDLLYKRVEELNFLPKTSAASVGDFINAFKKEIDKGNDVILISIGSTLSSSYQNALIAKEEFKDRIEVIDSFNLSTGIGLQVLKAAKLANEGKNIHEIKEIITTEITPQIRTKFAVESLEYLHKGGRCSGATRLFGTLLQIKPVISVNNGILEVVSKPKGKRKALQYMLDDIIANKDLVDLDYIMVTHTYAPEEALMLQAKLKEIFPIANVVITNAGSVISSHCGKGTIGILYIMKGDKR